MERIKDFVATNILARAMERKRGVNSSRFLNDVARIQSGRLEEIRTHQLRRLRKLLAVARELPPYAERVRTAGIESLAELDFDTWQRLRPVGREDIRNLGHYLKDNGAISGTAIKSGTGGTTSAPVTFYLNPNDAAHRWAATRYFDASLGYKPGRKIAYLWGAMQDFPNYRGIKGYLLREWIDRRLFLPSNHLQDEEMFEHYRRLREFKPCLLQAYATPLFVFSKFLLANRLNLSIPAITSTAEGLTDDQRDVVAEAFGSAPIRWYGAREAGRIATECSAANGLHINCYGLYVETSKGAGVSRVLITDLWSTLMPIIRYDIGDIAELDCAPCSCGSEAPRLKRLEGRVADMLIGSDGRLVPGVTMTNRILTSSDEIGAMQIIQSQKGMFTIKIVPGDSYDPNESDRKLIQQFNSLMESENTVAVEQVTEIAVEKSGKVLFSKNEMPPDELRRYI